ncbi:HIRAN domain-containing protein [Bifidobacterium aesculapii]|uniref:HIRAN domain-containing protein n=1 Tax=Bifidobacterium aesculapii TaxID=1329411 RepID=UPI000B18577C|nr:HIRAN domain-containing protein [Bifidobacterium aesculapii]
MTQTQGIHETPDIPDMRHGANGPAQAGAVDDGHVPAELVALADDGFSLASFTGSNGGLGLPQPYTTTIVLIDRTYLVGGRGFGGSGADDDMLGHIRAAGHETHITLRREPDDIADPWTVEALVGDASIGFVRAHENEIIARLMDAGKHVYAHYLETETLGEYHRIWVRLVMED